MKKVLLFLTMITIGFSCKKNYNGEPLTPEIENLTSPYYLDANLLFKDSIAPFPFTLSPDGDNFMNYAKNYFATSHNHTYSELYTGWDYIDTYENQPTWTPGKLGSLENQYGYTYGSVITNGATFGFFHPDGIASWNESTIENFFVQGKTFEFGGQPGQAEISYNKNVAPFTSKFLGLITTPESNTEGYLRIDDIMNTSVEWDNEIYHGKQITFAFKCKMYRQYTEEFMADFEGVSVVFIPYEE